MNFPGTYSAPSELLGLPTRDPQKSKNERRVGVQGPGPRAQGPGTPQRRSFMLVLGPRVARRSDLLVLHNKCMVLDARWPKPDDFERRVRVQGTGFLRVAQIYWSCKRMHRFRYAVGQTRQF